MPSSHLILISIFNPDVVGVDLSKCCVRTDEETAPNAGLGGQHQRQRQNSRPAAAETHLQLSAALSHKSHRPSCLASQLAWFFSTSVVTTHGFSLCAFPLVFTASARENGTAHKEDDPEQVVVQNTVLLLTTDISTSMPRPPSTALTPDAIAYLTMHSVSYGKAADVTRVMFCHFLANRPFPSHLLMSQKPYRSATLSQECASVVSRASVNRELKDTSFIVSSALVASFEWLQLVRQHATA